MRRVQDIHSEEFRILHLFKEYCDKHKLVFYLEGGTLLGAIRHKGFIPWDDDIDTIMPRKDYNRFIELQKEDPIGNGLFVVTRDTVAGYRWPYMKISNPKTLLYEGETIFEYGLFIDVFPIDGANNNESIISLQYKFMDIIKILENYAWMNDEEITRLSFNKRLRARICKRLGTEFWKNWLDRIFTRYEFGATKYVSQIAWSTRMVYNFTEEYTKQIEVEFEGEFFPAPSCYDERLKKMYGDYMKLPPEKDRHLKHDISAYWKD